jgi:hypothetical protein
MKNESDKEEQVISPTAKGPLNKQNIAYCLFRKKYF